MYVSAMKLINYKTQEKGYESCWDLTVFFRIPLKTGQVGKRVSLHSKDSSGLKSNAWLYEMLECKLFSEENGRGCWSQERRIGSAACM